MATFLNLPYDIKHSIIRQVDERSSLLSLISTCKAFYDIFDRHRDSILQNLYLSEAFSYAPDSIFFTYCRHIVHDIDNLVTLSGTVERYRQSISSGLEHSGLEIGDARDRPPRPLRDMVDDYLGIRKIALAHQYADRTARQEPDLSQSELRRIIEALYRGWALLLLLHQRLKLEQSKVDARPRINSGSNIYDGECIERLITSWDVWDVLRIQAVLGENLRILPTGQVEMSNSGTFNQFEADIPKSGLNEIVKRYPGSDKVALVFPISSMESYPSNSAYFALSAEFAQYLFINYNPATISTLYTLSPTPDAKTVYDRMAAHLSTAVERYLCSKTSGKGMHTQMPLDALQYTIFKLLGWYGPVVGSVGFRGVEIKSMRLVNRVSWLKEKVFGKNARCTGVGSWLHWARLSGCVYDEPRLEARGLEWPIFEY